MDYYYADGDEQRGPVTEEDLRGLRLVPETLVWREGLGDWVRIDSLPGFNPAAADGAGLGTAHTGPVDAGHAHGSESQPARVDVRPIAFPESAPSAFANPSPPPDPLFVGAPAAYAPAPGAIGYQTAYSPTGNPNNGMAVASLVLGIISFPTMCFYGLGIVTAILAIVFGMIARGKIRRREIDGGAGMALAGIICGATALGLLALFVVIAIGFAVSL